MSIIIAKRYAHALLMLSEEQDKLTQVHKDMAYLKETLIKCSDLQAFLSNPVISSEIRIDVIEDLFKKSLQNTTFHFLLLLEKRSRLGVLDVICDEFEKMYLEKNNILKVTVYAKETLNAHQLNSISHHLKLKLRKEIQTELTVDPSILGGIKIREGDLFYDYSIKTKLQNFKKTLIHR